MSATRFKTTSCSSSAFSPQSTMVIKVTGADTGERFTMMEQLCPRGYSTPMHVHQSDVEKFYVLEGSIRITCGERYITVNEGSFALLPAGIPHMFETSDNEPARLLVFNVPAGFERLVSEVNTPAGQHSLPPASPPPGLGELEKLAMAAARHGIRLLP